MEEIQNYTPEMPSQAHSAPQGMLPDDLGGKDPLNCGFEEILTDEGTPF